MPSVGREFNAALRDVMGATDKTFTTSLLAVGETLVSIGPVELYDFSFAASATVAVNLRLQDSSATAGGSTGILKWSNIPIGIWTYNFSRPIKFSKGLVVSYTASGASTVDINLTYSPLPTQFPTPV